jgi:hypothetical protein
MDPKTKKEERLSLVVERQEVILPTDEVQVNEPSEDEYYESPCDYDGYYIEKLELD